MPPRYHGDTGASHLFSSLLVAVNSTSPDAILLTYAELDARPALVDAIETAGFAVSLAHDGEEVLKLVPRGEASLLLLDLGLPGMRGPEVLRQLRRDDATRTLPVIALSPTADEIDRVLAFELGADDCVVKPFSTRELLLRIRAVLRRARGAGRRTSPELVEVGPLQIDMKRSRVRVEGELAALTMVELRLLSALAARVGRVQRREELLRRVWPDTQPDERTVDTHIRRLREKLGAAADWVETVRGVGYRLRAEAPTA